MNYKFCPRCGHRIPIDAQYCKYCGLQQHVIVNNMLQGQVVSHTHYWIIGIISVVVGLIIIASIFFGIIRNPKILPDSNFVRQTRLNNWTIKSRWNSNSNPYHEIVEFSPNDRIYSKISDSQGDSGIWSGKYKFYKNGKILHIRWNPAHGLKGVSAKYNLSKYSNGGYYFNAVNSNNDHGQLKFTKLNNHKSLNK